VVHPPTIRRTYWIGLKTNSWPDFQWVATNSSPVYMHWGTYIADLDPPTPEPNNLAGQEFCGGANSSEAWGAEQAFGWSDEDCEMRLPFMCKVASEWLPAKAPSPSHAGSLQAPRLPRSKAAMASPQPTCPPGSPLQSQHPDQRRALPGCVCPRCCAS
jgi:hypothetical protein